jgi:AraC-like DNA-binding protein
MVVSNGFPDLCCSHTPSVYVIADLAPIHLEAYFLYKTAENWRKGRKMELMATVSEVEAPLESALREIERGFDVSLTVHDLRGRLRHDDGRPLLPGRNVHQHPCCLRMRYRMPGWNARCGEDCFRQTEQTANKLQRPFLKRCWKGMAELVVPIFLREQHLLSILAGVFRHPAGVPSAAELPDWFAVEYATLPLLDAARLEQLTGVLEIVGRGIIATVEGMRHVVSPTDRKARIYRFFEDHAHELVGLPDLARELGVSPSRARHLVRELTARNFKSLLEEERMLRARNLLQSTDHPLNVIAETVGYRNGYYFNRAFKRYFGEPPGRFRRQLLA